MGDPRRFHVFGDFIAAHFSDRSVSIADVAGGKGYLQLSLRERGFKNITTFDRRSNTKIKQYHYGWFECDTAPPDFKLVVGMHPDEGTDHIILYAAKHRVPFVVCPCCVKPSAARYFKTFRIEDWLCHLQLLAAKNGMWVERHWLKIAGRNTVLLGYPME